MEQLLQPNLLYNNFKDWVTVMSLAELLILKLKDTGWTDLSNPHNFIDYCILE